MPKFANGEKALVDIPENERMWGGELHGKEVTIVEYLGFTENPFNPELKGIAYHAESEMGLIGIFESVLRKIDKPSADDWEDVGTKTPSDDKITA